MFIAPEIYHHWRYTEVGEYSYDTGVDIWALGICFYALMAGQDPFTYETRLLKDINCDNFVEFYDARSQIELPFLTHSEDAFSAEARDLAMCMLQVDPRKRI